MGIWHAHGDGLYSSIFGGTVAIDLDGSGTPGCSSKIRFSHDFRIAPPHPGRMRPPSFKGPEAEAPEAPAATPLGVQILSFLCGLLVA